MRACPACDEELANGSWHCSACGNRPSENGGIPLLAPEIVPADDFPPEAFETLAQVEHASFWFRGRNRIIAWALGRYFPEARSVLEVGCGTGFVLSGLQRDLPQLELTGGEASVDALRHVRSRVPGAETVQVDARGLPFRSEFDVVGAFDVLEHIDEDERAIESMQRAAKPGGGALITVPQHRWLWSANDEYGKHKRRYRRRELVSKVQNAGFEVLRVTSFVSFLLPAMAVSRMRQKGPVESFDPMAEYRCSPVLDAWLEKTLRMEHALIRRGVSLPAGGSLLLAAAKR